MIHKPYSTNCSKPAVLALSREASKQSKFSLTEMVEGGIEGTVNLVTCKPLVHEGAVFAYSLKTNYGDPLGLWNMNLRDEGSNVWCKL